MKKMLFIAIAMSLLLCATAFAEGLQRTVKYQKIAITYQIGQYFVGQTVNTRIHIRNIDPAYPITFGLATFINPDGEDVYFSCTKDGTNVDELYYNLVDPNSTGDMITIDPYHSVSINVNKNMLENCSDWEYPTFETSYLEGGRPFVVLSWGAAQKVVPPEIYAQEFSILDGVRESFDRWEGKVIEELK